MRSSPTSPRHDADATRTDDPGFRFTVPHVKPGPETSSGRSEQPAWRGITAGWLAAAESAA